MTFVSVCFPTSEVQKNRVTLGEIFRLSILISQIFCLLSDKHNCI